MRPVGAAGQGTANAIKRAAPTNGTGSLIYGNGPVQRQPQLFLDFWGAEWTNGTMDAGGFTGATAQTYIQTFLHDTSATGPPERKRRDERLLTWLVKRVRELNGGDLDDDLAVLALGFPSLVDR